MNSKVKQREGFGFYQLDPVPKEAALAEFYESQYYHLIRAGGRAPHLRKKMEGGEVARREQAWLNDVSFRDLVDLLGRQIAPGARVLDIGAGMGDFVAYLCERGFDAEGIEPAREPSAAARESGLAVHTADLASWSADPGKLGSYAAVTMINVLEHVPDPVTVVEQARSLLAADGVLMVRVPNDFTEIQEAARAALDKDAWWVFSPDHINYFSVTSLHEFLAAKGFSVVEEMGDFPMELFLLMGEDYIGNTELGAAVHAKRCRLEQAMPAALRQKMYAALASVGIGRNIATFARRTD